MKNQKRSSKNKDRAEIQSEFDSLDVIFRVQLKVYWDAIRCLNGFFASFGIPSQEIGEFTSVFHPKSVTKTVQKAYRFRLDPDDGQKALLEKHFGCARFVYNYFLQERKDQYKARGRSDKYPAQAQALALLKKQSEFAWLREVASQCLQYALRCLDIAYTNFFNKRARLPRKHKKNRKNSFSLPQGAKIKDGLLWLPKFKSGIRIFLHREIKGRIGTVTITKTPSGEYYASFSVEEEQLEYGPTYRVVGLDLGLKDLIITSDGEKIGNPKYLRKYERQLARAQKHLARKQKGSKGYERQRVKVARIHQKIENCRKDYLHKCALHMVRRYDIICVENLNIRGMVRNPKLAKSISDAGWGTFVTLLKYKALWNGKTVVEIPRFYPSSKTCSNCGYVYSGTKDLSVREWDCPKCGTHHDRDLNASLNVRNVGLKMLWYPNENINTSGITG